MLLFAYAALARTYDALWIYDAPNDAYSGATVTGVGDIDADGRPDLLVGSFADRRGAEYAGSVALFTSGGGTYAMSPDWTATGSMAWSEMAVVAALGDLNADGYDDFGVGAPYDSTGAPYAGQVHVWYVGGTVSATPDWTWSNDEAGGTAGISLSGGDVDGDGDAELLVGADEEGTTGVGRGGAKLFLGDPSGLGTEPDWTAEGATSASIFGRAVAGGGDVNGDGYGDIAVGAPYETTTFSSDGAVYVYEGSATGPSTSADAVVYGDSELAYAGMDLDFADFDDDGFDDLVVGMSQSSFAGTLGGAVATYSGGSAGLATAASWEVGSSDGMSQFGAYLDAGDIDADGYADLVVGAYGWDGSGWNLGMAFVYKGSASGLGWDDWSTFGAQANEGVGSGVAIVGDTDLDGYADFAVGAPGHIASDGGDGRVTLYSGGPDDYDGDGSPYPDDCDDDDPSISPTTDEVCDGVDQDCNELVDDEPVDGGTWYADLDGDTFGAGLAVLACEAPVGLVADGSDCDDARADVFPGAAEVVADGTDEDCDTFEACYVDADGDGFVAPEGQVVSADLACDGEGEAATANPIDCDDADASRTEDCGGGDDTATDDLPDDTGAPAADDKAAGCGCDSGGLAGVGGVALALALVLALRRRA